MTLNIGTGLFDKVAREFGVITQISNQDEFHVTWEEHPYEEVFTETFLKWNIELNIFIKFNSPQEKLILQLKY